MQTAKYGSYGVVTILAIEGALAHIQTENEVPFWVRAEKLKPVKEPKLVPTKAPDVDEAANAWQKFVAYLEGVGYKLEVHTRTATVEQVSDEYTAWSGESLPDATIKIYDNRPMQERCWRLFFHLSDGIAVPFVIDLAGCGKKQPTQKPRGLWHRNGRVEVYFASIIEQLVRAGLRATA